jgi:hypothetical protein
MPMISAAPTQTADRSGTGMGVVTRVDLVMEVSPAWVQSRWRSVVPNSGKRLDRRNFK